MLKIKSELKKIVKYIVKEIIITNIKPHQLNVEHNVYASTGRT